MCDSPSSLSFFKIVFWLDAEILDGCLDHKIFSVYPPPLSSKPGKSFLDCRAGFHGIHAGVLLCRYLEFSFLPSDKVRHHTCPAFHLPKIHWHFLLCDLPTPVLLPGKSHGWRSLVGCFTFPLLPLLCLLGFLGIHNEAPVI